MNQKVSWYNWLAFMFKEFLTDAVSKSYYEIVNVYECKKTGFMKAVIKLSERHVIEKNISDLVVDNEFLEGLDKQTIRTLTYMATVEYLKPDYSIIVQQMTSEVDEYLLKIKSNRRNAVMETSPTELSKSKELIAQFDPKDANRIGYLAGVRETIREYQILKQRG